MVELCFGWRAVVLFAGGWLGRQARRSWGSSDDAANGEQQQQGADVSDSVRTAGVYGLFEGGGPRFGSVDCPAGRPSSRSFGAGPARLPWSIVGTTGSTVTLRFESCHCACAGVVWCPRCLSQQRRFYYGLLRLNGIPCTPHCSLPVWSRCTQVNTRMDVLVALAGPRRRWHRGGRRSLCGDRRWSSRRFCFLLYRFVAAD